MDNELKLYNGIRVLIWKIGKAGGYKVQNIDIFRCLAEMEISGGQPFDTAYREAELLAVIIDAEFVLQEGNKIVRKSIKGEYK